MTSTRNNNSVPTEAEEISGAIVVNTNKENSNEADKGPTIRKGKVDSLNIYEITDSELEIIERGSPSSTYFNIGISLISIAISFLVTILTVDLKARIQLFTVFMLLTIVGFIGGIILILLWALSKNDITEVLKKIRNRMIE